MEQLDRILEELHNSILDEELIRNTEHDLTENSTLENLVDGIIFDLFDTDSPWYPDRIRYMVELGKLIEFEQTPPISTREDYNPTITQQTDNQGTIDYSTKKNKEAQ